MGTEANQRGAADWGSDFFGTLNEMPAEPVTGIGHILEVMATVPAYHDSRQWLLQNLGISQGSSVIEAGCGTGTALSDIVAVVGKRGRITGNDTTKAFVENARARCEARRVQRAVRDWRHPLHRGW